MVNAVRREREGAIFYDFVLVPMHHRNIYEDEILKAKKEAENANRSKGDFLSVVSHDLRTPLMAIFGWMEILKNKENDAELVKKAMKVIKRSAEAQRGLIEDVLDFARISSGKLQLETSRVDLAEVIGNAIELISSTADEKNIGLHSFLAPNVFVMGDSPRLQQVLWNLLSNAIKFTPNGGRVDIHLEQVGQTANIKVTDTGRGISADLLPYIFDRFTQGVNSKTGQYSGLGLGLAIARHLVELHGGTIRADSPGENKGASITVALPTAGLSL